MVPGGAHDQQDAAHVLLEQAGRLRCLPKHLSEAAPGDPPALF
jgi:hypothetical protein